MRTFLTPDDVTALGEIAQLLDEMYDHYFKFGDGYHKSSEGNISIDFGHYFDRDEGHHKQTVEIYSYVFSPDGRRSTFDSIQQALRAVRKWHAEEMEHDYSKDGGW